MARTLLDIKTEVATYFQKVVSDFTINGQDLFLMAANHVRAQAELAHDFEFLRKTVDVTVNGVTGGSLATAVDHTSGDPVTIKTVVECGLYDAFGNFRPTEWGPTVNNLELQRQQNRGWVERYPTDGEAMTWPRGYGRFDFTNDRVFRWPKTDQAAAQTYMLGIECYTISDDWDANDLAETLQVTGTLSPDATGTYIKLGQLSGGLVYILAGADTFFLWKNGNDWVIEISSEFVAGSNTWKYTPAAGVTSPAGTYTHQGTNTGNATVVATNSTSTSDTWTTYGAQFLLWATILYMNHRFKQFVMRNEGNLPPPQALRDEGLASFIEWDADRYTKFRREHR